MIPPGEARERGYANGTWGGVAGRPDSPFFLFFFFPLFRLSSPSFPLLPLSPARARACVRGGKDSFLPLLSLAFSLSLSLSGNSSLLPLSSRDGNCFHRERSFLLPSSAPLSSVFFFLSPSLLSSLFRFLSPLSSFSLSSYHVSWRRKLLPSPGNRGGVVMGLMLVVSLQKIKVIWQREWRALRSLPQIIL